MSQNGPNYFRDTLVGGYFERAFPGTFAVHVGGVFPPRYPAAAAAADARSEDVA